MPCLLGRYAMPFLAGTFLYGECVEAYALASLLEERRSEVPVSQTPVASAVLHQCIID